MSRWVLSLPVLAVVLAAPAVSQDTKQDPKEKKKPGLVVGEDLPGPFHPYNVTGPRATRYHCLVTQTSLDPVVMVVVRDLDFTEGLKALEKELDNRIAKNPNVRLSSFTVFLSEELPDVVKNDDKREELAAKLENFAKDVDLKQVVVCLDSKPDLQAYALDDSAWATVVLVKNYKVVAVHALKKDALNAGKVKQLIDEVAEKLGATRK
jgi:hypothetical protein